MATPLVANNVARIKTYCLDADEVQLGLNTTYWRISSIIGTPSYEDLARALSSRWATPYKNWMAANTTFYGVTAQRATPLPYSQTYYTDAGRGPGVGPSFTTPNQVTGLIVYTTDTQVIGSTGKAYFPQGRIFVPFPSVSFVEGAGKLSAAGFGRLEAIALAMPPSFNLVMGPGKSCFLQLQVFVRRLLLSINVEEVSTSARWATQKRRSERGVPNRAPF